MTNIDVYTKQWCPYCIKAKSLLNSKGLTYREIDVTSDPGREQDMIERSQRRTVPQVFVNSESIGGYDDLARLNASGGLDRISGIASDNSVVKTYNVAVIGAGPAGMSAAIYAACKNLSVAVIALGSRLCRRLDRRRDPL